MQRNFLLLYKIERVDQVSHIRVRAAINTTRQALSCYAIKNKKMKITCHFSLSFHGFLQYFDKTFLSTQRIHASRKIIFIDF